MSRAPEPVAIMPIAISDGNCEAAIGRPWRWVRELAAKHNVPRLPGKMPVYRADALLALFETNGAAEDVVHQDHDVSVDDILRRVGRKVGAR